MLLDFILIYNLIEKYNNNRIKIFINKGLFFQHLIKH